MSRKKSKPSVAPSKPAETIHVNAEVSDAANRETPAPAPAEPPANPERQHFLDLTAIQLFVRGFPLKGVWAQAETLWASREAYLKASKP